GAQDSPFEVANTVARYLLDKAGGAVAGQAFGFVMSAIGLNRLFPSEGTAALAALRTQLQGISMQLDRVQTSVDSLTRDLLQGNLDQQLRELRNLTVDMRDLYNTAFLPL